MILGIVSDSHDRPDALAAAVRLLLGAGAGALIHCGDICDPDMLEHLSGVPAWFVFGNNDWDRPALRRRAADLGIACLESLGQIELAGKRIVIAHGDDFRLMKRLIAAADHDYLLQGHTHIAADARFGAMRCVNPGALHRAKVKSVATLDLATDSLVHHRLQRAP